MDDWDIKSRAAVMYRRIKIFIDEVERDILREGQPFETTYALSKDAIPLAKSFDLKRKPVREGEVWGKTWDSGYFLLRATVPASWKGKAAAAWIDLGGEGLIYSREGKALYGITNGSAFAVHYAKDVYRLSKSCKGGEQVEIWIEAAANNMFGVTEAKPRANKGDPDRHGTWEARIKHLQLCLYDDEVWKLHIDMRYLLNLWEHIDSKSVRAARILKVLFAVTQTYRENPANAKECRAILAVELSKPATASALSTTVVGHAHIDTAWLWRLRETRRKTARTYASQLDLIEKYPDYVFGASAPQHHQWMKEDYPDIWERIKKAVKSGHWEVQGGMWIEADCNLPSGESLVRQFLHGKNFWKDEFGLDVKNCWIPDVFGYAGSMPQILRKAGVDFFLTQKLSWSKFNEFPHDTFRWRGIDGTEVVTHFPPEHTYNSYVTPEALQRAEIYFHEKEFLDEFITLMGIGDGGGGAKEEHVEHVLRARNLEGLPKTSFGRADEIFGRLSKHAAELDVWVGELYLEYHRGTFTTQARTKKNNRKLEQEIRAVEALWSNLGFAEYPAAELDKVLKILLLHQFHDIIPGSSIHAVYEDADLAYAEAFGILTGLKEQAGLKLSTRQKGSVSLFNCLSQDWEGSVALPAEYAGREIRDGAGNLVAGQEESGLAVVKVRVPACGFLTLTAGAPIAAKVGAATNGTPVKIDPLVLENDQVRYRFNADAELVEAWDKRAGRSILKPGAKGNVLSLYQDTPHNFDAWDIDFYYKKQFLETAKGVSHNVIKSGAVRQGIVFELKTGASRITQTVRLDAGSAVLTFETVVDWNESQRMLRSAFPLETLATEATCEIAYGYAKRPTHTNTDWDFAKFEVCAQRWVDISDIDYGVGLINDCKYGHSVHDNVLDITLLRSPLYPDPDADLGRHEFCYAVVPHQGGLIGSEVMDRAAMLNRAPLVFLDARATAERTPVWFKGEGISLEVIKKAEKEDAWILRFVETHGRHSSGTIATSLKNAFIAETDLMEWEDKHRSKFEPETALKLAPFEIRTYKISVKA